MRDGRGLRYEAANSSGGSLRLLIAESSVEDVYGSVPHSRDQA